MVKIHAVHVTDSTSKARTAGVGSHYAVVWWHLCARLAPTHTGRCHPASFLAWRVV